MIRYLRGLSFKTRRCLAILLGSIATVFSVNYLFGLHLVAGESNTFPDIEKSLALIFAILFFIFITQIGPTVKEFADRKRDMSAQTDLLSKRYLEEVHVRAESATPGPWISFLEKRDKISGSDFIRTGGEDIYLEGATEADQDFIAHAREDIPRLLREIAILRAR